MIEYIYIEKCLSFCKGRVPTWLYFFIIFIDIIKEGEYLADFTAKDVTFTKVKQELDDGYNKIKVEFVYNGIEYEYDIDAATGKIIKADIDSSYDDNDYDDGYDDVDYDDGYDD
ncbi:MAG: PepSY domain-containing protein [Faecalicoccus sp.]|nr:PepSY domain-containing protein [Faecalicoccus sp.]